MPEPMEYLFSTPAMAEIFSPQKVVRGMLAFEAALARAEARAGIIPHEAANAIAASCKIELFNVTVLYQEAVSAGTLAIPLVRALTAQVEGDARNYVHWGATSQDVIDSAVMLQMRAGLDLLIDGLVAISSACARLAQQYRHTLMPGRTLLQQALPITFGLKAARWLALVTRQVQALRRHRERTIALQFGGAVGTLAALGEKGANVAELLSETLGLPLPDLPWHAERDRVAEIASTLGVLAVAMAKIADDLILMAQTEVGEASEGAAPGKGGSSAMPQKRNPIDAISALASARLAIGVVPAILSAMVQEHERAAGGWQAEWAAIPDLFRYTAGAIERVRSALTGLQIDAARMQKNLDLTNGLIMAESLTMALAPYVGRPDAQRLVKEACDAAVRTSVSLRQVALNDADVRKHLSPQQIERALDPAQYLGSTDMFIESALKAYHSTL